METARRRHGTEGMCGKALGGLPKGGVFLRVRRFSPKNVGRKGADSGGKALFSREDYNKGADDESYDTWKRDLARGSGDSVRVRGVPLDGLSGQAAALLRDD